MVGGEVKLHGANADESIVQGPSVGVLTFVLLLEFAGEPVIFPSVGIEPLVKFFYPASDGLPCDANAFDFRHRKFGNVHVQQGSRGHVGVQGLPNDNSGNFLGSAKVGIVGEVAQAESDGRNSFDRAFHRG